MKCECCGAEITANDRYCPECGQNNPDYVEPAPAPKADKVEPQSQYQSSPNPNPYVQPAQQQPAPQYATPREESAALSILALIFGILGGWLGLILSIIGLCNNKKPANRTRCAIGLGFFLLWVIVYIILLCVR